MQNKSISEQVERVVRANIRTDNLIDVCDEDGLVLTTCNERQWFHFLKGINVNNQMVYEFKRNGYSVYSVYVDRLNQIIDVNNAQKES